MRKGFLRGAAAVAAVLAANCIAGMPASAADDDPNAETQKEIDRLTKESALLKAQADIITQRTALDKARIAALGLPTFEGKTTVGANSIALESWLLASTAVDSTAIQIRDAIGTSVNGKTVLILGGDEALDFSQVAALETEIAAITQRLQAACGCTSAIEVQALPVAALIGAAAGLLKSDTELTAIDVTVDSRILAAAVGQRLTGATPILPAAAIGTDIKGNLIRAFNQMVSVADQAQQMKDDLGAIEKPTNEQKAKLARLNPALARYDSFYTRVTTADKGVVPLAVAARLQQLLVADALVLRVTTEKSGGTLVKRTNLLTTLGAEQLSISGGLVASYLLTEPQTGKLLKAGLVSCRTALTSLRNVQDGAWRARPKGGRRGQGSRKRSASARPRDSAMDEAELRYGDGTILLRKSGSQIALDPPFARLGELEAAIRSAGARPLGAGLSSFGLLELPGSAEANDARLDLLRADPAGPVGSHVFHTPGNEAPIVPTGEIYLVLEEGVRRSDVHRLLKRYALQVSEARSPTDLFVRVGRRSPNPIKVAAALQKSSLVRIAEPDLAVAMEPAAPLVLTDPFVSSQWHLRNSGSINGNVVGLKAGADARVIDAWQRGGSLGAADVVVAVIDDGFDLSHPDLSGAGKVRAPWNFVDSSSDPRPSYGPGKPFFSSGKWRGDWHGTACAGLAVGSADGGGIAGAAPHAGLMPMKMDARDITDRQVEAWFDHARVNGAAVVSCSIASQVKNFPLSTVKQRAIARCARDGRGGLGTMILFAAGNDNRNVNDPAGNYLNGFAVHPDVIAVAGCTSLDQRSDFSNFGREISVCAPAGGSPGHPIVTADVSGTFTKAGQQIEAGFASGPIHRNFDGTSAATPIVAGICALMLAVRRTLTAAQARAILERTARKIPARSAYDANGHSIHFGHGCVNADEAIKDVLTL